MSPPYFCSVVFFSYVSLFLIPPSTATTTTIAQVFHMFVSSSGNSSISYNSNLNAFIGNAYTSVAGNTYFDALKLSDEIAIKADIGIGHTHSFLNGITIMSTKSRKILAHKQFHCYTHSNSKEQHQARQLLIEALEETARCNGYVVGRMQIEMAANTIIDKVYNVNQLDALQKTIRILLN